MYPDDMKRRRLAGSHRLNIAEIVVVIETCSFRRHCFRLPITCGTTASALMPCASRCLACAIIAAILWRRASKTSRPAFLRHRRIRDPALLCRAVIELATGSRAIVYTVAFDIVDDISLRRIMSWRRRPRLDADQRIARHYRFMAMVTSAGILTAQR